MRRWDTLLDAYIKEYEVRGVSAATVEKAWSELVRFGSWLKRRRPRPNLETIDAELVIKYLRQRTAFRAKSTLCGTISVLRGFGDYLVRQGLWRQSPLRWLRGPKLDGRSRLPRRIDRRRLRHLVEALEGDGRRYHPVLWLTVLMLLYGTGLRRGELERLEVSDWQREDGLLRIDGRKTGRERLVPVPEVATRCLERYLVVRHNLLEQCGRTDETALLVNRQGRRLKGTGISQAVHRLSRSSGLGRITLHMFRHSCASDLLEEGLHLAQVQEVLGHQTIATTMRYLHIADPQRQAAVALHPINEMLETRGEWHEKTA